MTSKKYKKPPIVEAVCEFQFEEDSSWDLVLPGLVYEKIRNTFPIRRQITRVTVGISGSPEQTDPQFEKVPFMQFLRKDEKALIQVGAHLLSVNILKPYPSWQKFLPLIKRGVDVYRDVVSPKGINRIGLRYINHIEIPGQNINLEDYLEIRPFVGLNLPQDFGPFVIGIQFPYENARDILNLQLSSLPKSTNSEDAASVILSLDYFLARPKEVAFDEVFRWVEVAHMRIEDVFEACLTDKLRQLFKEVVE